MKSGTKNCAIYTRKSTEEGLDQDFNSLDAQCESCEAYITSQKAEGWKAIKDEYNDGGFSGGHMERPGLKKLLGDICTGKIQIVVVYKIDRLTRSLMDFAKLVEIFDEHHVTFVSVTQSFNTTTSMGRLTLNVLLSFAQFEREVTGERIRDKLAASKKKGMWMGGYPPLGYQRIDKKLVIAPEEAKLIKHIFNTYHKLGTVRHVYENMKQKGYKTPKRTSRHGNTYGGKNFSRGHIHKILTNPVYAGKIRHKDAIYEGQHEAIIDERLFQEVQQKLKDNIPEIPKSRKTLKSGAMLQGLLFDIDGSIYSPTYTTKSGRRYCYYISQNLLQYKDHPKGVMARLPAHEIEDVILNAVNEWISNINNLTENFPNCGFDTLQHIEKTPLRLEKHDIRGSLQKVILSQSQIEIQIYLGKLSKNLKGQYNIKVGEAKAQTYVIKVPFKKRTSANGAIIIDPENQHIKDPLDLPPEELKRIVKGIIWRDEHFSGQTLKNIAAQGGHGENYVNRCIQESFKFLSQ